MGLLKLLALDTEDLQIISAHVQDAVARVGDLDFRAAEKRFLVPMNRFAWETQKGFFSAPPERRQSVLHFEGVTAARLTGISQTKPDEILSLLTVAFVPGDAPAGVIELVFSGGAAIRLDVAYVEARLADLGGAWAASSRPMHRA
jgi:hypothetical protein